MPIVCLAHHLVANAIERVRAARGGTLPPAPPTTFEPCSQCGAGTPDEVALRCTSFNRARFERGQPCHGESPR